MDAYPQLFRFFIPFLLNLSPAFPFARIIRELFQSLMKYISVKFSVFSILLESPYLPSPICLVLFFFCPDRNKSTWVNLSSFLLVSINYKCRKDRLTLTGHHYSWFVQADLLSFYLQIPTLDFSYKILVDSMWTFLRIKLWILLDIMQRIP